MDSGAARARGRALDPPPDRGRDPESVRRGGELEGDGGVECIHCIAPGPVARAGGWSIHSRLAAKAQDILHGNDGEGGYRACCGAHHRPHYIAVVHGADGEIELSEDAQLRRVAQALGMPPESYDDMVVTVIEEIDLGEDLDKLRYGDAPG